MTKVRKLTVSTATRVGSSRFQYERPKVQQVPSLRLVGDWLNSAGFGAGVQVNVSVEHGRITIERPQMEVVR